jgi:hypothetical protein
MAVLIALAAVVVAALALAGWLFFRRVAAPVAGYVRALRESRYRDEPSHPTRAQRRGLRSELGRGGGIAGRIRAWWALPPR